MGSRKNHVNKNPVGYRTRKGHYWLKDKLDNCTVAAICPDCEEYFVCLEEYAKR